MVEMVEREITDRALNDLISRNLELGLSFGNERIVRATVGELRELVNEVITKFHSDAVRELADVLGRAYLESFGDKQSSESYLPPNLRNEMKDVWVRYKDF